MRQQRLNTLLPDDVQEARSKLGGRPKTTHPPRRDPCHGSAHCGVCKVNVVNACGLLDSYEITGVANLAEDIQFASKERIIVRGEPADCVYNITAGTVCLYRLLSDGRRQVIDFLLPGDFFGLSLTGCNEVSADAVEPVRACRFDQAAFTRLVDSNPHLLRHFFNVATHELHVAQDHLVLLGRRTAEEKVAAFLLTMRNRMRRLGTTGVTLHLPMTRQDIADYLGLTLETVSRTVSRLNRQGVVLVVPDGLRILDPARLEELGSP